MKKKRKLPVRSLALVAAALLLFTAGGVLATRAELTIFSQNYIARFELDHLDVALVENGDNKIASSNLILPLGGRMIPGKAYREEIAAENMSNVKEYVRLSLRTYWMEEKTDENGQPVLDKDGKPVLVKNPELDPSLIHLTYGNKPFNDSNWQINNSETTAECRTYYYSKVLNGGSRTEPVVNRLVVSGEIMDEEHLTVTPGEKVGNKTIYKYIYEYDGKIVCIEADVQSLQVHNPNDAIRSIWGVQNVRVSGENVTVTN